MGEIKPWRECIEKHEAYMIMCDVLNVLYEKETIKKTVYERLKQAPTIDAVEVVRCKDCIHYESDDSGEMMVCNVTDTVCDNDDFCSYGERREDGEA